LDKEKKKKMETKLPVSKKRKTPHATPQRDPLDLCIENAIKQGHGFIVKRGNNPPRSYNDDLAFFESYCDPASRKDSYEFVPEIIPRKFYLKLNVSCEEEQGNEYLQKLVDVVVKLLKPLVEFKGELMVVAFKESKSVYDDGENKWKLSLMIVFLHLICPLGKSMMRLVQRLLMLPKMMMRDPIYYL
jgi:hypothetical protein